MKGAVAFTGTYIDKDRIKIKTQSVQDNGSQDRAVHPGKIGGCFFNIGPDQKRIKVMYFNLLLVKSPDHSQRRHADNPDLFPTPDRVLPPQCILYLFPHFSSHFCLLLSVLLP